MGGLDELKCSGSVEWLEGEGNRDAPCVPWVELH